MIFLCYLVYAFLTQSAAVQPNELLLNASLLPEFVSHPPSLVHVDAVHESSRRIACKAWPPPPFGNVTYYTVTAVAAAVPLHPVPSSMVASNGSALVLSGMDIVRRLSPYELHCLASTKFGSVLSPPFKLSRPVPFSEGVTVHHVPKSATASVRCSPQGSPSLAIRFTLNDSYLPLVPSKHLVISPIRTADPSERELLIRDFSSTDEGVYHCLVSESTVEYEWIPAVAKQRLILQETSLTEHQLNSGDFPPLSANRALNTPSDALRLSTVEGTNVSLRCNIGSQLTNHTAKITRNPLARYSGRHNFIMNFGVYSIDEVAAEDEGFYHCSYGTLISSIFLSVRRKLRVQVTPALVYENVGASVSLSCSGFEIGSLVWYHNGRLTRAQFINGSNSSLHIKSLSVSSVGVYQCVQRNRDGWASAQAVVILKPMRLFRKDSFLHDLASIKYDPVRFRPTVLMANPGKTVSLSCLPSNLSAVDAPARISTLSGLLPGASTDLYGQLHFAQLLDYVHVEWLKDGVLLQLPRTQSVEPQQFDLPIVRSHDFGVYECTMYADRPLSFHATRVIPGSSFESSANAFVKSVQVANAEDETDRGKRNVPDSHIVNPFGGSVAGVEAELSTPQDAWFNAPAAFLSHSSTIGMNAAMGSVPGRPEAVSIGDNLAVNITWTAVQADLYRIQFKGKLSIDRRWSKPSDADGIIHECCGQHASCCGQTRQFYFTSRQSSGLEPGGRYQFRVLSFTTGNVLLGKSPWSQPVSFEHISQIAPVFTETERLSDGSVVARWNLPKSAVGFPIDHFLLLYRMEIRQPDGKIAYGMFQHVFVPGSNSRECKLVNLEPGRGYQLVVYGVHTPPGLDPRSLIFQGGVGGRRMTQFSHEIFVKPRTSDPPDAVGPGTNLESQNTAHYVDRGNGVTIDESNRLMFLILGALAGIMSIIVMCLVILCVCRQLRNKRSQSDYKRAVKQGVGKEQYEWSKSRPGSTAFMLEHLNAVVNSAGTTNTRSALSNRPSDHHSVGHCSTDYPHPPPSGPPPPPPRHANQDLTLEAHPVVCHGMVSHSGFPIWTTDSHFINHTIMTNNYLPNQVSAAYGLVSPHEMKREPPCGGSVHGGTDTEADSLEHVTSVTHPNGSQRRTGLWAVGVGSGHVSKHTTSHNMPAVSDQTNCSPQNLVCYPPVQPDSAYLVNPVHQWLSRCSASNSMYHPFSFGSGRPTFDSAQYPHSHSSYQFAGEPRTCSPNDGEHLRIPGQQLVSDPTPASQFEYVGRPSSAIIPYQSQSFPQSSTQQICSVDCPGMNGLETTIDPCAGLGRTNHHLCGHQHFGVVTSHDPSVESCDNHPIKRHQRHRRRRLTTEDVHDCDENKRDDIDTPCQPLVTSSPINHGSAVRNTSDRSSDIPRVIFDYSGYPVRPSACPMVATSHVLSTTTASPMASFRTGLQPAVMSLRDPQLMTCRDFVDPNPSMWAPHVTITPNLQCTWNQPPRVPYHRGSAHSNGPLNYGNYNPVASNSFPRRDLIGSPPRVRDYSEYGIPNVHGKDEQFCAPGSTQSPSATVQTSASAHSCSEQLTR